MMKQTLIMSTLTVALLAVPTGPLFAADQDQIYGSQLMTQQERFEYRKKYSNAKTSMERERIRNEHHVMMKERAKVRNMKLPDEPPASGAGMGPGHGMEKGGGMGSGGGGKR